MPRPEHHIQQGRRVTLVGVVVNAFLIAIKFLGGYWGHSQALIADAIHSVSDLFTDAVVLVGLRLGNKAPDQDHPFGHARYETLASALVGLTLLGAAAFVALDAIRGFGVHHGTHPGPAALIIAALSLVSKEALYQYTVRVGRRINSPAVQANAWHHRSDALSSVVVFAGVAAAMIKPTWHVFDSAAALVVAVFITWAALKILRGSVMELTDTAPGPEVLGRITACAGSVPGVVGVHDIKVRSSGGRYHMEIHVEVPSEMTVGQGHGIAKEVEQCLVNDIEDVERVIVHVDPSPD